MKEFIKKHKIAVVIGIAVVARLVWYFFFRAKRFTDNFHAQAKAEQLGLSNPTRFGGNVGFTSVGKHGLKVGDKVKITQDAGAKNPQYDGEATVASILDDYNFSIDKGFALSSPVNPGKFEKI